MEITDLQVGRGGCHFRFAMLLKGTLLCEAGKEGNRGTASHWGRVKEGWEGMWGE